MRILFDARSVRTPAGYEVFRGLTSGWVRDARVSETLAAIRHDFDPALVPSGVRAIVLRRSSWLGHLWIGVAAAARLGKADIVFSPNGLQPRHPCTVVYFQDVHHFRPPAGTSRSIRLLAQWWVRRLSQRYASHVTRLGVCVSNELHRMAAARLKIPMVVVPNGVDVGDHRWVGRNREVFVMGGRGARKSEENAVRAWQRVPSMTRHGWRLMIAGVEPAARRTQLAALIRTAADSGEVSLEGTLSHSEFLRRIATARLSVACSSAEAFGLPAAEALALGAPVLCSDIPAHAELVGRARAGGLFAVGDEDALARALTDALHGSFPRRAEENLRELWGWATRAREHVNEFARVL